MKPIFLFVVLLLTASVAYAETKPVNLCFNNYPPYAIGDESGVSSHVEGIQINIVQTHPRHFVFIYKKSRFPKGVNWKTYNDISNLKLGINSGSFIDKKMESAFTAVRPIERPTNVDTMISMLMKERYDLGAMDKLAAHYVIRKLNLDGVLDVSEQVINDSPVYFGISRKSEAMELLPGINKILDRMNTDGTMTKLIMEKL